MDLNSSCTGEAEATAELSLIVINFHSSEWAWRCGIVFLVLWRNTAWVTSRAEQESGESLGQSKLGCRTPVLQKQILNHPKYVFKRVSRKYFPFWSSSKYNLTLQKNNLSGNDGIHSMSFHSAIQNLLTKIKRMFSRYFKS